MADRIDNADLRKEILRRIQAGELSWSELARRLGHMRPATCRVQRAVGYLHSVPGNRRRSYYSSQIDTNFALEVAEAAGIDPVDVGL